MLIYLYNFFIALACTIGFGVLFNVPRTSIIKSGFAGGIGWVLYNVFNFYTDSTVLSVFVASFAIAILGEVFAIKFRNPSTVYIVPAIVPLVPGYGVYYTMLSFVQNDYESAANHGSESFLVSIAIAGALTIVLSVNSFRKQRRSRLM